MSPVPSPLRYPGAKSRARKAITDVLPSAQYDLCVDACVGGGNLFLLAEDVGLARSFWINDKNSSLIAFYHALQDPEQNAAVRAWLRQVHNAAGGDAAKLKDLRAALMDLPAKGPAAEAARFFFLNRVSFSGIGRTGGFSASAAEERFTASSIDRLVAFGERLHGVRITNLDILELLPQIPDGSMVLLDPPYKSVAPTLYGESKRGDLHSTFPHVAFSKALAEHSGRFDFLLTYDREVLEVPEIALAFADFEIRVWELGYSMSITKRKQGGEVFVLNYEPKTKETHMIHNDSTETVILTDETVKADPEAPETERPKTSAHDGREGSAPDALGAINTESAPPPPASAGGTATAGGQEYFSVPEIAKKSGVSKNTIYRMLRDPQSGMEEVAARIPFKTGPWRIHYQDFRDLVHGRRKKRKKGLGPARPGAVGPGSLGGAA